VSRPRTLDDRIEAIRPEHAAPVPRASTLGERPRGVRRFWGLIPLAVCALLLGLRACLHAPQLEQLAVVDSEPGDPPGTVARAGSIAIVRGGPVIIGFQSDADARLTFAGHDLRGKGLIKDRFVIMHGPAQIRFAAPDGARLVWSPVGRRGDPEYVPASSLTWEAPATAKFDAPGAAPLDGLIALGLLVTLVVSLCVIARRRLAAVSRDTWIAMAAVLVVALVARLVGLGDQGQTWDEDVNWAAARNYVTNVVSLDFADRSWIWNFEHPPVMKLLDGIGAQFADGFGPARAMSALWISLGCALLVPIGARLYRLRVGVLAAAIAALLPPLVAHGQVVGHEAPTILWWSLGILLALGVHDYLPANDRRALRVLQLRLAWVGVVIGVAIASRFVNGLLGPLCAVIIVLQSPQRWRLATIGWGAAIMPVVSIVTVIALWPRLWLHPIANLEAAFAKLAALHSIEPFLGTLTNHPGPHYFVVYLFATLPVGLLAGIGAWFVRAVIEWHGANKSIKTQQRGGFWARWMSRLRALGELLMSDRVRPVLIVMAWLIVPLGVVFSPVRQDGVRYVMPCILALAMMAGAGFDSLAIWAKHKHAFAALASIVVLYLGITLVRARPYYLDYFGEHTGGAGSVVASRAFETAWWGEGLDQAIDYVNEHADQNAKVLRPTRPRGSLPTRR
jgi:4-amino-4-deoxy-L-arabinose transferase-like glycosyltransferase